MDLFIAIAMLCQTSEAIRFKTIQTIQLECQQSYVHCVNIKSISMSQTEALNKCIMEKK